MLNNCKSDHRSILSRIENQKKYPVRQKGALVRNTIGNLATNINDTPGHLENPTSLAAVSNEDSLSQLKNALAVSSNNFHKNVFNTSVSLNSAAGLNSKANRAKSNCYLNTRQPAGVNYRNA